MKKAPEKPKNKPKKPPAEGRDANGRYLPGHAPGRGRPKVPEELKRAFQVASEDAKRVLIEIANNPKAKDSDRIRAAEVILDRGYGKPVQAVDVDGSLTAPVMIIGDVLD